MYYTGFNPETSPKLYLSVQGTLGLSIPRYLEVSSVHLSSLHYLMPQLVFWSMWLVPSSIVQLYENLYTMERSSHV